MVIPLLSISLSHEAKGLTLCGVELTYPNATVTTNSSPCLNVQSVSVNSTGITSHYLANDELRQYNPYFQTPTPPINAAWNNQSSGESDWQIQSAGFASMKVTGSNINSVFIDYVNAPNELSSGNGLNSINIGTGKLVQLIFNGTSPNPVVPQVFAQAAIYNQTAMLLHWSNLTRTAGTTFETFADPSNNGTYTALLQARNSNSSLNVELGTLPSLPLTLESVANATANSSTNATQTLTVTEGNHNSRVLVVGVSFRLNANTNHNAARISSVSIGSMQFINQVNTTITCGANTCDDEIWTLDNPPVGTEHITITPTTVTTYYMVHGVTAFYNARVDNNNSDPTSQNLSNSGTSTTPNTGGVTFSPNGVYAVDNLYSDSTSDASAFNGGCIYSLGWNQRSSGTGILGGSVHKQIPGFLTNCNNGWTTTNNFWIDVSVTITPVQNPTNSALNLLCTPVAGGSSSHQMILANGSTVYYGCGATVNKINLNTGIQQHLFTANSGISGLFMTNKEIISENWNSGGLTLSLTSLSNHNASFGSTDAVTSNQQLLGGTKILRYSFQSTSGISIPVPPTATCGLTYLPTNRTSSIDTIGCDQAVPANDGIYWNGMAINNIGGYSQNSTLPFYQSVEANKYLHMLTLTGAEYNGGFSEPFDTVIIHSSQDYMVVLKNNQIYYLPTSTIAAHLASNRAIQTYFSILQSDASVPVVPSPNVSKQGNLTQYGPAVNATVQRYGVTTEISGYTLRAFSNTISGIRTIDPQWTNDLNNYPFHVTNQGLFQVLLTVNNAPVNGALEVTNPYVAINGVPGIWSIVRLDTTHSAEFDIPVGTCANINVADSSKYPLIYNFEGNICATGSNLKTIAYTNTLPLNFWTYEWGATSSYTPTTNALQTTVRHTTSPFVYQVIVKNSTGQIAISPVITSLSTLDTQNFNVSGVAKPASLYILGGGAQIYSAYLGSPVSIASVSGFFNQYFTIDGFSLVTFIPIIFAAMFTRNTVGIGVVLTVLTIATLSWLSVIVVPDLDIMVMMVIAVIGLIAYRIYYG